MSITQEMRYRLSAIKCAERFGIQRAAANCHTSPSSIYRWRKIYKESGENLRALGSKSRRPKTHPNAHTEKEIKLITDMRRRNPNIGLQDLWIKLRKRGYTRTQPAHVKYVPKECLSLQFVAKYGSTELYQYTAIDEYSRYRILCGYREHNTYSSSLFLCQVVSAFKALGIEVECVQTDNGSEFTKQFIAGKTNNHSMFEVTARRLKVKLKRIKPHTPRHNGKVERSHREDQKLLYSEIVRLNRLITDENSFKRRLKRHQDKTNNRPMRPLNFKTPKQVIEAYKNRPLK